MDRLLSLDPTEPVPEEPPRQRGKAPGLRGAGADASHLARLARAARRARASTRGQHKGASRKAQESSHAVRGWLRTALCLDGNRRPCRGLRARCERGPSTEIGSAGGGGAGGGSHRSGRRSARRSLGVRSIRRSTSVRGGTRYVTSRMASAKRTTNAAAAVAARARRCITARRGRPGPRAPRPRRRR